MKNVMVVGLLLVAGAANAQTLEPGVRVFIEQGNTVDAKQKAHYSDFGLVLAAALQKKKVPVVIVTDVEKATLIIRHSSTMETDSTGTRVAKMALGLGFGGRGGTFEGAVAVIDRESTAVVFSFNTKKGKAQSGAENFAGKFKELFKK